MKSRIQKISRQQLDRRFSELRKLSLKSPREGWIKTIRESLGMGVNQLAKRLGIRAPTLSKIEDSERKGTITLSTLNRAAEALDCEAHVILLPKKSLEENIREQSKKKAMELLRQNALQMNLEAQGVSQKFQETQIQELAEELARNLDRRLWGNP